LSAIITISVISLFDAFEDRQEENDSEEQIIDDSIYFYLEDEEINLDGEMIVKNHLDYQQEFIEEIKE
jgi:hypothetical protein